MSQTRWIIVVSIVVSAVLFAVGLLLGFYVIPNESDDSNTDPVNDGAHDEHHMDASCTTTDFSETFEKYRDRYLEKAVEDSCSKATCNTEDLPRTYLAYHLNGQTINIDGKLDDPAWDEIPWTDNFVDISGEDYPEPRFNTKVKVRWNDQRLYVGARMEETHFWGNITEDETSVWKQNAFEAFIVPDGSFHNYKEMQINVLNTTLDLLMRTAYMDWDQEGLAQYTTWSSGQERATYTDGIVNNLNETGTYWSVEWSFSFVNLSEHTKISSRPVPDDGDVWFFNFARVQYGFKIVDGEYKKDETIPVDWWSWQPMHAVNLHIPSRYGLVKFIQNTNETQFTFDRWHIYRTLFEIFDAEHKYKATNGAFSDDVLSLNMVPKLLSLDCVNITISTANSGTTFMANVTSVLNATLPKGHIKQDRYVWFT